MQTNEVEKFVLQAMRSPEDQNHKWALMLALEAIKILIMGHGESVIKFLCINLKANFAQRMFTLLLMMQPRWFCGGDLMNFAPDFSDVQDELISALDCEVIDFETVPAVLIGRYGPDAEEALPELLERLRRDYTNCSKSPGLTWAVYQIGGIRPEVKKLLIKIATSDDSCPHSAEIAKKALKANQIEF